MARATPWSPTRSCRTRTSRSPPAATGGGSGPVPGSGQTGIAKPRVRNLRVSPRRVRARQVLRIRFSMTRRARVRFTLRRHAHRWLAARHAPRSIVAHKGANTVRWKLGPRLPGTYQLMLKPVGGRAVTARFTVRP